mmetsp:Transcript_122969/g.393949  ORF Transcript_122969/g.393949 Transcript_122969/m.393949 type:complete len:184 (+) Transcript_122969:113-664(+)|eukprot:CAMPEP_0177161146 /NCGR_PEP_ID=MMETSP0367-20130122/5206_1 /TAXON_ID=447022 ORGANISM="Scrippsiella hangoei-like, Strain SHHI-4" /NCGR_SAMPLE_ID=MMETSP0367 /ASSEMBLY_ACC=CAM_ASM_000362 /LENGTH=183 /DNA_ID=CAMNT_0018606851 /DNA_START=108 /DNA_END=659 /DNA_ORIENTATION=+
MAGLTSSRSAFAITAKEPSYAEAFYGTSNGLYKGHWHDGTRGSQVGDVPTIQEILAARPTIRKPIRPLIVTAKTVLADAIRDERRNNMADKVLSADVVPKKFPVEAKNMTYPTSAKKGADNPLYACSSQSIGKEVPMAHQITDRYFPSTNAFTKGFVDTRPRYTGLSTAPTHSKVHCALDEAY